MEIEAEMLVDGVSITEEPLFGQARQWHFSSLLEALKALVPGGTVSRRRLSSLSSVVEQRLIFGRGEKRFEKKKTDRARVKSNDELIDVFSQILCEQTYIELNRSLKLARAEPHSSALATLQAAAEMGEFAYKMKTHLAARGIAAPDITLALAACYGELLLSPAK